jgi:hypothetical protein
MISYNIIITYLRFIIFAQIIFGLVIWTHFYIKNKEKKDYGIAPILFSIHAIIFLMAAIFNLLSKDVYIIWRDLVTIHGILIYLMTGMIFIQTTGGKNNG